jgi:hypothetical protein
MGTGRESTAVTKETIMKLKNQTIFWGKRIKPDYLVS